MRVLYIVPYAPSLIRVRPYQLIRALVRLGHEVTVATLWTSPEELEAVRRMARDNVGMCARRLPRWRSAWNCLRALPTRLPLQACFSFEPGLLRETRERLASRLFDIVHVEHLRGSLFGLGLLSRGREPAAVRRAPVVWDSVDCISHLFRQAGRRSHSLKGRWMARLELPRTRRFEGLLATRFDRVLATSAADRDALLELRNALRSPGRGMESSRPAEPSVSVLPNGVDLEYFHPRRGPRDDSALVFTGKMSYHANVTAAQYLVREVMPRVWSRRPDVKVFLVGQNPPRSLRALASRHPVSHRRTNGRPASGGGVEVTGTVPDIRPFLGFAAISVLPLVYGAGIQNKVLEAMACATPVVTSPGAVGALSARPGRELLVADGADAFAAAVLELLDDRRRRDSIGRSGRAYVETHHDWDRIGRSLESIYRETIESFGGAGSRAPMRPSANPTAAAFGNGRTDH